MDNNQKFQTPKSNKESEGTILGIRKFRSSQSPNVNLKRDIVQPKINLEMLDEVKRQVSQDISKVSN